MENFTSKDIVAIISACHKNKVNRLKLAELEIVLDGVGDLPLQHSSLKEPVAVDLKDHIKAEEQEDQMLTDIQRHILLSEDPQAYEAMMLEESKADAVRHRGTEQSL